MNRMLHDEADDIDQELQIFFQDYSEKLLRLLREVASFLEQIKTDLAPTCVVRHYSRREYQGSDFKTPAKIAQKLKRWRKIKKNTQVHDLHDIIAVSIVVLDDKDITSIYKTIKEHCGSFGFKIAIYDTGEELKLFTENGYHAQHLALTSRSPILKGLKCEVQVKTLLHDAFQIKMHDLVYKPEGELSNTHRKLMTSFGESIQAIEIQTQTVRQIISQEWQYSNELRYTARTQLTEWLEVRKNKLSSQHLKENFEKISNDIFTNRDQLKRCTINDPLVSWIIDKISTLRKSRNGLSAAWPLMVYVASVRQDNHLNTHAKQYVRNSLQEEPDRSTRCFYLSFTYYVINERMEAIKEIERFLRTAKGNETFHRSLKFNLLYYLIEEAGCSTAKAIELKPKCDYWMGVLQAEKWRHQPKTAVNDTIGYYHIVFGETPEEVKKGIRICQKTKSRDTAAAKYLEIHEAIGWRRYVSMNSELL